MVTVLSSTCHADIGILGTVTTLSVSLLVT
jgi:hypothetical protein